MPLNPPSRAVPRTVGRVVGVDRRRRREVDERVLGRPQRAPAVEQPVGVAPVELDVQEFALGHPHAHLGAVPRALVAEQRDVLGVSVDVHRERELVAHAHAKAEHPDRRVDAVLGAHAAEERVDLVVALGDEREDGALLPSKKNGVPSKPKKCGSPRTAPFATLQYCSGVSSLARGLKTFPLGRLVVQ